jgi:uncharacterized protein YraI
MKRNTIHLGKLSAVLVAALFVLAFRVDRSSAADDSWNARYWNNRELSGDPVLERQEANLEYDWGQGSPAPGIVNPDNFSARWRRVINVSGGTYRFRATTDDGMRVWVDDVQIIDSWYTSEEHTIRVDRYLDPGEHTIRVRYFDAGGRAVAKLSWSRAEDVRQPTGPWLGEYFNNMTLSGVPALTRWDDRVNFNFGGGSPGPGVAADQFSVRWTNNLNLSSGRYRFTAGADDGVRLWVNNQLIIDRWINQATTFYNAEITVPGGVVPVRMEYFEEQGGAEAILSWVQVGGAAPLFDNWRGEYFNNKSLSGTPALIREDVTPLSFNWGAGSPAPGVIAVDNFSARWTRTVNLNPGLYRFTAVADDGIRVWVNGQLLINGWSDHQSTVYAVDVTLPGGQIPLKVEYYENVGLAEVRLTWTAVTAIPPSPTNPIGTVTAARLNVRTSPVIANNIMTQINRGTMVQLLLRNESSTWVKVIIPDNRQGWVLAALLGTNTPISSLPMDTTTQPPISGLTATVRAFRQNVRTGPGTANSVITTVPIGTTVTLLGRNAAATWVRVALPDSRQGWMLASLLNSGTPIVNLPVVP